jgi:beta-glucosidase-like glycosyl hydrolase
MQVPGEDPHLTSRYVAAFVRGLQEGDDPRYLKVIATCKHFFGYDVDYTSECSLNASTGFNTSGCHTLYDRHSFNAQISRADLVEYYLPAWEACVKDGKAASIMCTPSSMLIRSVD